MPAKLKPLDNMVRELARRRADKVRARMLDAGMSNREVARFEKDLYNELRPMLTGWQPSTRTGEKGIKGILSSGRFKNQFETGTSGGALDASDRRMLSQLYFGTPEGRLDMNREKYGFLKNPARLDDVGYYGRYEIGFNPSVRKRMTVTNGDSMNNYVGWSDLQSTIVPTPIVIDDPETYLNWYGRKESPWSIKERAEHVLDDLRRRHSSTEGYDDYVEAQYHGPLGLEDVSSIRVPTVSLDAATEPHQRMLMSAADKYGFEVRDAYDRCIYNCK